MSGQFRRAVLLAALMAFAGAPASAGTIVMADDSAYQGYVQQLQRLIDDYRAQSSSYLPGVQGEGMGQMITYDPETDPNVVTASTRIETREAKWARSGLRIYDLYTQLGGNPVSLEQSFRFDGSRYYVALDTVGGQWFATSAEAHGFLLKMLVAKSAEMPQNVKDAVGGLASNDLETVVAAAREAIVAGRAFIGTGSVATASLRSDAFAGLTAPPTIQAPQGVSVRDATLSGGEVSVTLAVAGDARLGPGRLLAFRPGTAMAPVDSFEVFITRSSQSTPPPAADDHGATIATATPLAVGGSVQGSLGGSDDADLFSVVLASPATLTLQSTGGSDLVGQLEDGAGTVLASDDDGGGWYNVKIVRALGTVVYYLRVRHCCAGTGDYGVTAEAR
jgi:hypothetical protein